MKSRIFLSLFLLGNAASGFSQQQVSSPSVETNFQNFVNTQGGSLNKEIGLTTFQAKEEAKGSPYLFDKWVNGTVTNSLGVIYKAPNVLYNYNKMNQKLLAFIDSKTVFEINNADVSAFTVTDDSGTTYTFERLKNSTDPNYYQPVVKSENGFSLYNLLRTEFKKSDYVSNGLFETGKKYDEYIDRYVFYILSPKKELIKIEPKDKGWKSALMNTSPKFQSFMDNHKKSKVDEEYLTELVNYLNAGS